LAFLLLVIWRLPDTSLPAPLALKERLKPITDGHVVLALLPAFLWNVGVYVMYPYIALLLQQQSHISDISILLACFGLGIVLANALSGLFADRFKPDHLVIIFLLLLIGIQALLPLAATTIIGGAIILLLWGMSFALLFIPQQQRLLRLAPEHSSLLLALNNSALYLGIAGGAAGGGLALHFFAVTQLAWIGGGSIFVALLIIAITLRLQRQSRLSQETK
ncbi:MAG TPA: MFS transporter, partial [Ktedonobacteraceae bacterium]|nr:MFS transporter [Ktedonobacteraceae bacterium]